MLDGTEYGDSISLTFRADCIQMKYQIFLDRDHDVFNRNNTDVVEKVICLVAASQRSSTSAAQ